jgi:hypothetical protein
MIAFDYQMIPRPRRKTASVSVKPDCTVRVLVPVTLLDDMVAGLLEQKRK